MSLSYLIALPLPTELEILEILWCRGAVTAKEIYEVLVARRSVSYRALKTILTIMQTKGFLEKSQLQHPASYRAMYSRSEFQHLALTHLASTLFHGDMSILLHTVLTHSQLQGEIKSGTTSPRTLTSKQVN
jgi:predicted transcriptional regulator